MRLCRNRRFAQAVIFIGGLVFVAGFFLLLCGCTTPAPAPVALDNVPRLIAHPQFKQAAKAAPDFTTDALDTIAALEREISSQKP